jgi:hypothetical protein
MSRKTRFLARARLTAAIVLGTVATLAAGAACAAEVKM